MLKYFKRQKSHRKSKDDEKDRRDASNGVKRHSLRSTSSFCDEIFLEELSSTDSSGYLSNGAGSEFDEDIFKYHSRLSMSLLSIVSNPNCLSYFVQFMETKNALPLIKFYLDTENFKTAAVTQFDATQKAKDETATSDIEETLEKEKELNNCVPELKTLCDLSMRQPLTDDEKSQIYAETNKKITKCHKNNSINNNNNNNHTLNYHKEVVNSKFSHYETDIAAEGENVTPAISAASVQDAIAIFKKYLIGNTNQLVQLPVAILSEISLLLCKRNDDGGINLSSAQPISANCFGEAQKFVLQQMERDYLHDFLTSTFYCKYCIELIEKASAKREDKLSIYDILHSEIALFFFMEYLEQRGERNCLDFWTTAINFRKSFSCETMGAKDQSDAKADAMIIYEKFFSLQAEFRLWMSDKLRSRVEESICSDGIEQMPNCFDLPLQVTAKYLEQKHLEGFLESQLFENYLSELKTKVHEELAFGSLSKSADIDMARKLSMRKVTRHRKTLSDCTNESTLNTLLAMDTSQQTLIRNQLQSATTGTNMNIDSSHLTNPSLLWQRAWATNSANGGGGGLKFGRINSLGRYERDFDTVDGSRHHNWSLTESSNKIKNAMRKLVNLPEERVQEEIAWQVAEMIVKDVTSVTLNDSNSSSA